MQTAACIVGVLSLPFVFAFVALRLGAYSVGHWGPKALAQGSHTVCEGPGDLDYRALEAPQLSQESRTITVETLLKIPLHCLDP